MKTTPVFLLSALALVGGATARALDPAKWPSRVEVVFLEPEKFTDVKESYMGTDKGRDSTLELIKEYLVTRGGACCCGWGVGWSGDSALGVAQSERLLADEHEQYRASRAHERVIE